MALRVLSSCWASWTAFFRNFYMLSICCMNGICDLLTVRLSHLSCVMRFFMPGSFLLLSRRMACLLSMLTSGSVGKGEDSRTWFSLSEVTTSYLKKKAARRSNAGSCCLFFVDDRIVFVMKSVPHMYSSLVVLKETFVNSDDMSFIFVSQF